jgi:hypothetical protein
MGAAVIVLLAAALLLLFQARGFLDHFETRLAAQAGGDARLQAMGQHMEALRGKFNGLLAESIETRLKALEKNIDAGKVGSDDLRAFEELQKDLKLLENYAGRGEAMSFDYAQRDHSRFRPLPDTKPVVRNDELMSEVLELKNLLYFCAAGLLAMGGAAVVGCYWIAQRGNGRYLGLSAEHSRLLPSKDHEG